MQGSTTARRNWLAAFGILFCMLAAVFAVEAKLGWYSPNTTARVELSASKLPGDDAPRFVVGNLVSTPAPVPGLVPQAVLFVAAVLAPTVVFIGKPPAAPRHDFASSSIFPPQFLRPPPRG